MLHGELPTELATLSQLKSLVLDGNHFSGDFKFVVNNLTALDALIMSNNNFTTVIDSSFLATSINLTLADFSQNNITLLDDGIFPTHLFSMPQLQLLDLSHNKLKGTLPDGLLENTVLQFLALDANQLKGNLSPSLANLKNLTSLSINNNGFIGSMDMFGNMTNLVSLFLSENAFGVGTVPTSFARLTMLSELSLRNTKRQGLLPDFIGNFTNLLILDLGTNALSGAIPSSYGELPNLQYLLLNDNTKIKGSLPATFKKLESLSGLFVEGSTLTGSLNFLCGLPNIQRNGAEDILLADCFGATPKINCTCPACQCCPPTLNNSCPQPLLSSLDASWETNFMRQSYDFVNGTKKIQKHSI